MQFGSTPLDCASSIDCIIALLDAGAVSGRLTPRTTTSLHIAAKNGSLHLVRRLLAAGASVDASTEVRCLTDIVVRIRGLSELVPEGYKYDLRYARTPLLALRCCTLLIATVFRPALCARFRQLNLLG